MAETSPQTASHGSDPGHPGPAEDTPGESRRRYESLVQSIDGIVWELDAETFTFTFVSRQAERILGYPVGQWLGEPNFWANHIHPDDRRWAVDYCVGATRRGEDHRFEYRMIAADGRVIWLSDIVTVDAAADGRVLLRGVMVDITERKRAEEGLRESEERLRQVTAHIREVLWLYTPDYERVLYVNPAYESIWGRPRESLLHDPYSFLNAIHPEDRARVKENISRGLETGYEHEYRVVRPDGTTRWVRDRAFPIKSPEGRVYRVAGIAEDVTERRLAQEELRRTTERLQLATGAAGIGIWDWDVVKDELIWDDAMYGLFGIRKEDFSGAYDAWASSLAPEDFERATAEVRAALRGERGFDTEFRIVWPDGSIHYIKGDAQTFRDEGGRPLRMVGVNYDITERKRAAEAAKASEERLRLTFEAARIGTGEMDLQTNQVTLSDAMQRVVGLPPGTANLSFEEWVELIHPEDRAIVVQAVEGAKAGRPDIAADYRIVWPDGSVHWMTSRARAFYDEAGGITRIVGAIMDITERQQAQEALRESEARLRAIFEEAGIGISLVNMEGRLLECNPALQEMLGYSAGELRGMSFTEVTHPDDVQSDWELFQELVAGKRDSYTLDKRYYRKDGELIYARLTVTSIPGGGGRPQFIIGMAENVTESWQAEERLRREKYISETSLNSVPGVFYLFNSQGRYIRWNKNLEQITGYTHEEIAEIHPLDFFAGDDKRYVEAKIGEVMAEGQATAEANFVAKDGRANPYFFTGRRVEINGEPCVVGMGIDITERKRAEEALRESERRFSDTLTNVEMIAVMTDIKGDLTFCNDYLLRLTGWRREEVIGRNWYEMFLPEHEREKVSRILGDAAPTGDVTLHMENEIKTRSGERRLVKWTNTTLRGPRGGVIGLAALGDDITERKQAEEELMASREQLRALSESLRRAKEEEGIRISRELHDELGGSLTTLKWGLIGLGKAYPADAGTPGGAHARIAEMVGLVDATVNAVRRISSELRPGVLDDLGLVAAIEWHAHQFQASTGIVCRFESQVENVELSRDQATAVFRIFQEALTNVLRHARASKVNVLMEEEEGELLLEVGDNGRGITEAERLGAPSLGLLGMRERAHAVGGRIEISGTAGRGTTLIVRLPLSGRRPD